MDPIIHKVFSAEEKARTLVEDARTRAARIVSDAAQQAEESLSEIKANASKKAHDMIEEANKKCTADYAALVESTRSESDAITSTVKESMETAAQRIVDLLKQTDIRDTGR